MLQNGLSGMYIGFKAWQIQWCWFQVNLSSSGLYVCIILITAHHKTTLVKICNITQKTTPEENTHEMFHISPLIVLFSYGKVKDIFGIRIKFHYNMRYKLCLTNCWSDRLLTTTNVISMPKNLHVTTYKWFWPVLPGQKNFVNFYGTNTVPK